MKKQYISPQFYCSDYSPDTAISVSYGFIYGAGCTCTDGDIAHIGQIWIISAVGTDVCDLLLAYNPTFINRQGDADCEVYGPTFCGGVDAVAQSVPLEFS